jgi:hypothetical protein
MAVPYTFGSATTSIPLSQLDSNFATTITLGNTAIQLGNTVTTLNNMTLANATVSSGNITVLNATVTNDASISGLTVGKGGGAVSTNTAVGSGAMAATATGTQNTALGYQAGTAITSGAGNTLVGGNGSNSRSAGYSLTTGGISTAVGAGALGATTTASANTAIGYDAMNNNTTGADNIAMGNRALINNTTGGQNTGLGRDALFSNTTNTYNTAVGYQAGYSSTGGSNTFIGAGATTGSGAGSSMTTGSNNVILGAYTGNNGGLDIRTSNNYIVLSDGSGNPRQYMNGSGQASWGSPMIDGFLNLKWAGQSYIGMVYNNTDASGSSANIRFKNNGTTVGDITSTTSATSYNTSSDYRLKHDVQPMVNALAKISQLKPVTYKWNIDASVGQGFIAHELQEVFPDAVHGEKDAVEEDGSIKPQGIDTSFLVATLAASIQELKTIVDAQAAEIAELKAKVGA